MHLVEDSTEQVTGRYALKRLQKNANAEALRRFANEIDAIQKIDHPNVIKIVDHNITSNPAFYVMEYVEGSLSLRSLIKSSASPYYGNALMALRFFRQLLEAIDSFNTKGILHRDLNPSNILILPDHTIKIIDFGVCHIAGHDRFTEDDEGVGTKDYMAPECEPGNRDMVQMHADLYSAAKILWTAATNKRVFAREAPAFTTHCMAEEFPTQPEMWHLQNIFEVTIRKEIRNRLNVQTLLKGLWATEYCVTSGKLPKELSGRRCPHCFGDLTESPLVNGLVPSRVRLDARRCSTCGSCFVFDEEFLRKTLKDRRAYE